MIKGFERGGYKYIKALEGESLLFKLSADPHEEVNLIESRAAVAERMEKRLKEYTSKFKLDGKGKKEGGPDPKAIRNLKALGYLP